MSEGPVTNPIKLQHIIEMLCMVIMDYPVVSA